MSLGDFSDAEEYADQDEIEWREVEGFPKYLVSSTGVVYNTISGKNLSQTHTPNGYRTVGLSNGDIKATKSVHRLVAIAFVPGRTPVRNVVNHIDGYSHHNHFTNLEWLTLEENNKHYHEMRRQKMDWLRS